MYNDPEYGYRPPQQAAPISPNYGYQPQQPQHKRRIWPWVLGGVTLGVMLLCGAGALLLGGAASQVDKQIQQEQTARADSVKITSCKMDSVLNIPLVDFTVTNTTDKQQDYIVQFNIVDKDGVVVGSASDIASNVPAGGSAKGQAMGSFTGDKSAKFKCVLVGA